MMYMNFLFGYGLQCVHLQIRHNVYWWFDDYQFDKGNKNISFSREIKINI